jgi:hypothetical protein
LKKILIAKEGVNVYYSRQDFEFGNLDEYTVSEIEISGGKRLMP